MSVFAYFFGTVVVLFSAAILVVAIIIFRKLYFMFEEIDVKLGQVRTMLEVNSVKNGSAGRSGHATHMGHATHAPAVAPSPKKIVLTIPQPAASIKS